MKVRKSDVAAGPSYPDAKEFLKSRGVLGATMLGAGILLGGCKEPHRTAGVAVRTLGEVPAQSLIEDEKPIKKADPRNSKTSGKGSEGASGEVPRLPGKPRAEPKVDPPARLLGDMMEVPRSDPQKPDRSPVLGGVPPVVPPNLEP